MRSVVFLYWNVFFSLHLTVSEIPFSSFCHHLIIFILHQDMSWGRPSMLALPYPGA